MRLIKKIIFIFVLYCLIFAPGISNASSLEDFKDLFDKYEISISATDLAAIKDVYEFWNKRGSEIWPGAVFETTPVCIVFPEKYDVLIGHGGNITDSVMLTENFPVFDKKAVLIKDNTFMNGAMTSPNFKGVPTVFINTIETTNNFTRNYGKKNNIKELANYKVNLVEHMGKILHELFHAYQYSEMKFYPKGNHNEKPLRLTKVDYPYLDSETVLLLGIEGKIMAKIFEAKDTSEIDNLWSDFLCVRKFRHSKLDAELVKLEEFMEFTEGTAQYVGLSLNYASTNETGIFENIKKLPEFNEIKINETFNQMAVKALNNLSIVRMNMYMNYVYVTGMAQACILGKIKPGWQKDAFRKYRNLNEIIFKDMNINSDPAKLNELKMKYGADSMTVKINEEMSKINETNKKKFDKFNALIGKKFKVVFEGANAKDILIYGPVLLTEHENMRIFEAGCSKIERINDNFDTMAKIEFKAAVPIFFDKNSGDVSFIIENAAKQNFKITSKSRNEDGNKIIYENDVNFKNDIFEFSVSKIEVISTADNNVKIIINK